MAVDLLPVKRGGEPAVCETGSLWLDLLARPPVSDHMGSGRTAPRTSKQASPTGHQSRYREVRFVKEVATLATPLSVIGQPARERNPRSVSPDSECRPASVTCGATRRVGVRCESP